MELPKIKNENLPEELKAILGNADLEFDAIVDPMDIIDIRLDSDLYEQERQETAKKFVESRKKLQELRSEVIEETEPSE